MVSGPPQPPRPLVTVTDLYSGMVVPLGWWWRSGARGVEPEARQVRDHDGQRTREHARDEDGGHTHLDSLRLRLTEGQAHGDEVAAHLRVDGEQRRQRVLGSDVALRDARADQDADHLCDDRSRAEHRRQDRDRAEDADREQTDQAAGQRLDEMGQPVAEAGLGDDADQDGDERHERQDVADDGVDGVATGLVERADDAAGALADRDEQLARAVDPAGLLLGRWCSCCDLLLLGGATGRHPRVDELGHDAADQDHDHADQEVAHRQVAGVESERRDAPGDAEVDEELTGVGVREDARDRVHEADRRVVERRLVALRQEAAHRVAHRVGQEEDREHRQHEVPHGVPLQARTAGSRAEPVDLLRSDQPDERVDRGQQDDQGRDDPGDEAHEHLAAGLEEADEPIGRARQGSEEAGRLVDRDLLGCPHDGGQNCCWHDFSCRVGQLSLARLMLARHRWCFRSSRAGRPLDGSGRVRCGGGSLRRTGPGLTRWRWTGDHPLARAARRPVGPPRAVASRGRGSPGCREPGWPSRRPAPGAPCRGRRWSTPRGRARRARSCGRRPRRRRRPARRGSACPTRRRSRCRRCAGRAPGR